MSPLFLNNLFTYLDDLGYYTVVMSQNGIKECLEEEIDEGVENFPMICFEHTEDSPYEVELDESKFLNDSSHDGYWILGRNDEETVFLINLRESSRTLEIDTIEVGKNYRGQGLGRRVVEIVEDCAEDFFDHIVVSPFDTEAMNFWNHMEYVEQSNGYWRRRL